MAETTSTSVNVANRIDKLFKYKAYYLKGTAAETAVIAYLAISEPSRDDLNTLRASLNS